MDEIQKWKARFERERASRKESEKLLESKSMELWELNNSLKDRVADEISKNREKEEFLSQQSKLASMGEMIGNIAHQWRQPLSAITSTASSINLQIDLGIVSEDDIKTELTNIINKAQFLSDTIEDFRNFFKTDNKKDIFDTKDILDSIKTIITSSYKHHNITMVDEVSGDLRCFGLKGELSQVLINIFNNAKDILVEKNIENRFVKVVFYEQNNYIKIRIYDNAGGIPQDILPKIFDPYFTTKHQAQGTGIGLYMSREIIHNHFDGTIKAYNRHFEIQNNRYYGACFKVEIPKNLEELS
jgi:signal transduction histidine kinase